MELPEGSRGLLSELAHLISILYWLENKPDYNVLKYFHLLMEMATHSSVLAWRIPGMGEPGRLLSMGSHELDTTEAT